MGVDQWIVSVIRAMYEDVTTKVRSNGREREITMMFFYEGTHIDNDEEE